MPVDPMKRQLRELKRAIKKRGNKKRRADLKRDLAVNPEEAAHTKDSVGRHTSTSLNGLDGPRQREPERPSGG